MATQVDVQVAVAGLYRLPLAEFVPARDQLARQLRAAGDREAARQVASLRRPSISAWAANQLAQAAPLSESLQAPKGASPGYPLSLTAHVVSGMVAP